MFSDAAETSIGSFDKEKLNKNEASNHVPAGLLNMFWKIYDILMKEHKF